MKKSFLGLVLLVTTSLLSSNYSSAKANNMEDDSKRVSASKTVDYTWFDYKRGLFKANHEKKYILLSFCKDNDSYCDKLYTKTFSTPEVKTLLEDKFVPISIDVDSEYRIDTYKTMAEKELVDKYEIEGFPTILFLDSTGKIISGSIKGAITPEKLLVILKYIYTDAYKKQPLTSFEAQENSQSKKKN